MPIQAFGPVPEPPPQPEALPKAALWRPEQWRCHLYGLHWDGTQELLAPDVPVSDLEVTTTLSGTDTIKGTFTPEIPRLAGLVEPWATAVLVEFQGEILAMCIVDDDPIEGAGLQFTASGFFGYLSGLPFTSEYTGVKVDPLDVARLIWSHVQSQQFGNLGLVLDGTTSDVRIGAPADDGKQSTGPTSPDPTKTDTDDSDDGPYVLAWYQTSDLGSTFTDLATSTPFDFREVHTWNGPDSGDIHHRLQLGYPSIGRRQHELRFHVGENIVAMPTVDTPGDEFATQVLMLGSGEGSKMLRATVNTPYRPAKGRAWRKGRRVAVVDAKDIQKKSELKSQGQAEAAWRAGDPDISQIVVMDHLNAPFGSWANGDDINITADDMPWAGDLGMWVRVLSTTYNPAAGTATLTVVSSERTNRDNS